MADRLQNLDPTGLKRVFGQTVLTGNPSGQGKEPLGATDDPSFQVTLQKGTVRDLWLEGRVREDVQALGHRTLTIYYAEDVSSTGEDPAPVPVAVKSLTGSGLLQRLPFPPLPTGRGIEDPPLGPQNSR